MRSLIDRRDFLRGAAATPLAGSLGLLGSPRLWAAPAGNPRVLVVFLRGAYDCANLLVPVSSSHYYEQRPNIAIAKPGSGPDAALPLDGNWGLHPALAESMLPLYERRELAFIPFAGTDDLTRSHFETQDSIELGQPLTGTRNFQSGFLNRLARVIDSRDAIAFTAQLPLTFQGGVAVPNLVPSTLAGAQVNERQAGLIQRMYAGSRYEGTVRESFAVRDEAMRDLQKPVNDGAMAGGMAGAMAGEMQAASRNAVTAKGFEGEARRIARLMRERYRLGFVDVGGWDTHVAQGAAQGYLAGRLAELGKGLAAYADEMGAAWADTTVVVLSEFGRTFKENGNRGTDHGHGTVYWVLGGGVRGGRIAGEQQALTASTLFQGRDYPILNEYRATLGGLFARLYGLNAAQVQQVFPGVTGKDIGLV